MSGDIRLEPVTDAGWLDGFIGEHWGKPGVVTRGRLWSGRDLRAIRAMEGDDLAGVVSWRPDPADWELISLNSLKPNRGIGTRLTDTAVELARRAGARRLWLITTNDNLDALRFYQRRGWRIVAVHVGAIGESRRIKPSIAEIGAYGIPIRDEIELEYPL
ncbi:MAG: GNAT family N-acetyltransferase [Bauldia sp.]